MPQKVPRGVFQKKFFFYLTSPTLDPSVSGENLEIKIGQSKNFSIIFKKILDKYKVRTI